MTQLVSVSLMDLALLAALFLLFGASAVLAFAAGIQLSRSQHRATPQAPAAPPPLSDTTRLGDVHWQKVRKARLELAGHRCEMCNSGSEGLHAHHRTYARRGQELVEDLIILCRSCHGLFHKRFDLAEQKGPSARQRPRIVRLADYPPASDYAMPIIPPAQDPPLPCSSAGLEIALKILAAGKQPTRGEFKRWAMASSIEIAGVVDWLAGQGQIVRSGQGAPTRWADGVTPASAPALADRFRPYCPSLPRFVGSELAQSSSTQREHA